MLHTKFCGKLPAGSGDFEGFFTIYGRGCHLCHVTSIMSSDYHFFIQNLVQKIQFEFLYAHVLGPRSRNDRPSILTYPHILNKMSAPTQLQVTGCNSF